MGAAAFAVTTRSRLRGLRFFPSMFVASLRIRRQLERTRGCVCFASVIAGPREFWTVTVWDTRDNMLEFMRSGEHERIMWRFGKWLRAFWLMRWRPTGPEGGTWDGKQLARPEPPKRQRPLTKEQQEALDSALDAVPHLKAAMGPHGAPAYDSSPIARRHRHAVQGSGAIMVRIAPTRFRDARRAWRDLKELRRELHTDPAVLRSVIGVSKPREFYALAVVRDLESAAGFLELPAHKALLEQWGDDYWMMAWEPANEFGHWDGFRLRQERKRSAIQMPAAAARSTRE